MDHRWTDAERALWARIAAHPFADPTQGLDFRRRLAREQGWAPAEADAVIGEYRRFCFLACVAGHPVTPSDEVDQVWHLHLTCTEDYWLRFCPEVLRQSLHHGPTRGGPAEDRRYREQYAATLAAYERAFGPPPERWWPGTRERFARPDRWVRVDRARHWLLPKPTPRRVLGVGLAAAAWLVSAGLAGSAHAQANPLDWTAGPFLTLYLVLMVVVVVVNALWRRQLRGPADGSGTQGLTADEIAYLAGGPTRVLDATVAGLFDSGHLDWDPAAMRLRVLRCDGLSALPALIVGAVATDGAPDSLQRRLATALEAPRRTLVQRQLWLDDAARSRAAWHLGLLPGLLTLFGFAKIAVGIVRDKPVLFITFLTLAMAVYTVVQWSSAPTRTRRGDLVLRALGLRHARLKRAPMPGELPLAVALAGTSVLGGTSYAAYHRARQPTSSDGSSGGWDGDSGGNGGSSGCGGCGGGGD
jgi:uncharacterized protein (TIGR04222 family)